MDSTLIIPLPRSIQNPSPFAPVAPGRPLYYDDFSGGNTTSIVGRNTIVDETHALGVWQGTPDAFAINSGNLVRGTNTATAFAGIPAQNGAQEIIIQLVKHADAGGAIYLDLYRSTVAGSPDSYRLRLQDGQGTITTRVNGAHVVVGNSFNVPEGSIVGIRHAGVDGWLTVTLNGSPVAKLQIDSIPRTGMSGIAMGGAVTGFQIGKVWINQF